MSRPWKRVLFLAAILVTLWVGAKVVWWFASFNRSDPFYRSEGAAYDFRTYQTVTLKPHEAKTVPFDVIDADDWVRWEASWGPFEIQLRDPNGRFHPWKQLRDSLEGLEWIFAFKVADPAPGTWQMYIRSKSRNIESLGIQMLAESKNKYAYSQLKIEPRWDQNARVGEPVLEVELSFGDSPIPNAQMTAQVGGETLPLLDDGAVPDKVARDGIYTSAFNRSPGRYKVELSAKGIDPLGRSFHEQKVVELNFGPPSSIEFSGLGGTARHGFKDSDGDGLYDKFICDVGVIVSTKGVFKFDGSLGVPSQRPYVWTQAEMVVELEPGGRSVALEFPLTPFAQSKLSGRLRLTSLSIAQQKSEGVFDEVYTLDTRSGETLLSDEYRWEQLE